MRQQLLVMLSLYHMSDALCMRCLHPIAAFNHSFVFKRVDGRFTLLGVRNAHWKVDRAWPSSFNAGCVTKQTFSSRSFGLHVAANGIIEGVRRRSRSLADMVEQADLLVGEWRPSPLSPRSYMSHTSLESSMHGSASRVASSNTNPSI